MAETSIQDQIAAVQLETAQIELEEAKFRNAAFKAAQETSRRNRENRQAELQQLRANEVAKTVGCRHRQGGFSDTPYQKGNGPSCVSAHKMPFGEVRLQCNRCAIEVYEPNPAQQSDKSYRDPWGRTWKEQKALFDKLFELHEENGLAMSAGPQFTALKDGVPVRPVLV